MAWHFSTMVNHPKLSGVRAHVTSSRLDRTLSSSFWAWRFRLRSRCLSRAQVKASVERPCPFSGLTWSLSLSCDCAPTELASLVIVTWSIAVVIVRLWAILPLGGWGGVCIYVMMCSLSQCVVGTPGMFDSGRLFGRTFHVTSQRDQLTSLTL